MNISKFREISLTALSCTVWVCAGAGAVTAMVWWAGAGAGLTCTVWAGAGAG